MLLLILIIHINLNCNYYIYFHVIYYLNYLFLIHRIHLKLIGIIKIYINLINDFLLFNLLYLYNYYYLIHLILSLLVYNLDHSNNFEIFLMQTMFYRLKFLQLKVKLFNFYFK
jgi:hypothetical protein